MPVVNIQVAASSDDAGCFWNGANWQLYNLATTYAGVGYFAAGEARMGGGYRFLNVPPPPGSTINSMVFKVVAQGNYAGVIVNSRFHGQKDVNPVTFSDLANYQARRGVVVGGADDTHITVAVEAWDGIGAFLNGVTYTSPELKTIANEIIGQPGYAAGQAWVIFWDDHDNRSTNVANTVRPIETWDDIHASAAILTIDYTPPSAIRPFGIASRLKELGLV